MKRIWNKLAALALGVFFIIGFFISPSALLQADEPTKPVGSPNTTQTGFFYLRFLRTVAGNDDSSVIGTYSNFGVMINLLVNALTIGAGIMFFFLILSAGYKLIFAGGKEEALRNTRKQLTIGIVGMIIVMAAYWITNLLLNITGINKLMV